MILDVGSRENFGGIPKERVIARYEVGFGSALIMKRRKDHRIDPREEGERTRSVRKRNDNGRVVGTGVRNYTSVQRKPIVTVMGEDVIDTRVTVTCGSSSREGKIPFGSAFQGRVKERHDTRTEVRPGRTVGGNSVQATIARRVWNTVPVSYEKVKVRECERVQGREFV